MININNILKKKKEKHISPKIIGITGNKFTGKDTLGKYLEKYNYKIMCFADPLKEVIRTIFDFNDEQLYGELKDTIDTYWNVKPRTIMQFIGTDLFRHQMCNVVPDIKTNIWIKVIKKRILDFWEKNPNQSIVLTDLRFPNEINMIKELNGCVIRIKRTIDKSEDDFVVVHESETYIDTCQVDFEFDNNGTKEELYKQFDDLFR